MIFIRSLSPEATFRSIKEVYHAHEERNRAHKDADCTRILALEERVKELEVTHRALGEANFVRISVLKEEARELKELVETHCTQDVEVNAQTTALQEAREHVEKLSAILREKEEDIENLKEKLMVTTQLRDDTRSAKDAAEARAETSGQAHGAAIAEARAGAETVTRAQLNKENENENENEARLKRLAERRLARNTLNFVPILT
ncbi:hypothetical protein DXG01_015667 [Tephrocybe rancida]|nr:hypothetical protein DXG01_015667 [Tephrocybe rancida]